MKIIESRPSFSLFSSISAASSTSESTSTSISSSKTRTKPSVSSRPEEDSVSQRLVSSASSSSSSSGSRAATSKFHRAALDGYIDMLCDASRRDTNLASHLDGFTPTLLAAHSGQLEALRILVGRGGEPERTTTDGSSGLHLAAARGHLNCVSFLVNFGVNMWALDNELHTAKDVAAIEQRQEVLNYLDQMMAKQSALNTKTVQKLKEKAKVSAEKRLKQMRKAQLKAIKQIERDERYLARLSNNRRLLKSAHSISDIRLVCKSSSVSSQPSSSLSSSRLGSELSYPSSHISTTPIGSLLAAVNRQNLNSSVLSSSPSSSSSSSAASSASSSKSSLSASSPAKRLFGPSNSKPAPKIILTANHSLLNQSSADESNSMHSSLSSSTSRVILAPADRPLRRHSPASMDRPKYSELVAIRKLDADAERQKNPPIGGSIQSATKKSSNSNNHNNDSNNNATSIGSKLTKGLGGVSRKVHLRKFLQVASSTSDLAAAQPGHKSTTCATDESACNRSGQSQRDKPPTSGSPLELDGSSIRWPPAPTLSRTISEPDFNLISEEQSSNNDHIPDSRPASSFRQPPEAEEKDESQHRLLTQCLSQLKLRHEQSSSGKQSADAGGSDRSQRVAASTNASAHIGHSDELLLHQRLNGGSSGRLIRPSLIKQQIQQKQVASETPNASSADSIGSASSLMDRSKPGAARPTNLTMINSNLSSVSLSSSSCSYANSSCKTSASPCTVAGRARHGSPARLAESPEAMDTFLQSSGLMELSEVFSRERIDLEALMLLTEDDLKSLDILLGPRRKLLKAIEDRRQRCPARLQQINGSSNYVMVDTQL